MVLKQKKINKNKKMTKSKRRAKNWTDFNLTQEKDFRVTMGAGFKTSAGSESRKQNEVKKKEKQPKENFHNKVQRNFFSFSEESDPFIFCSTQMSQPASRKTLIFAALPAPLLHWLCYLRRHLQFQQLLSLQLHHSRRNMLKI